MRLLRACRHAWGRESATTAIGARRDWKDVGAPTLSPNGDGRLRMCPAGMCQQLPLSDSVSAPFPHLSPAELHTSTHHTNKISQNVRGRCTCKSASHIHREPSEPRINRESRGSECPQRPDEADSHVRCRLAATQACEHTDTPTCMHAGVQARWHAGSQTHAGTPACKHADVQACRSTGMQAHRHAGMQACRPAIPARIPTGRHESVQGVRGATGRDTWGSRDLVRTILGESRFRVFLDRPPKQANRRSTVLLGQPPCNERMSTARHGQRKHSVQALSVHGPPSKWMNRNPVRIAVICFRTCSASGPQSLVLRRKSGSRDRLRRAIGPTCAACSASEA